MTTHRRTFLKQVGLSTSFVCLAPYLSQALSTGESDDHGFLSSAPELQGITSESILKFIESVENDRLGLHSLMIVRHGKVVASGWWDPYKPALRHMLFSLSKSFTSTAVGLVIAEGRLTVEDKVTSFFPEFLPAAVSDHLAAMRVKDLLTMTSGHDKDTMPVMRKNDQSWVKTFLSLDVAHKPGTYFLYNSGATYMLSAIVQKLSGHTVLDYLKPRLMDPLGISGADWETSPQGINAGAYGLRIKTEDIAKFGQLYLQKGKWNGKQLLPESWIKEATSFQVPNVSLTAKDERSDWQQGYGYQFWRCWHNIYRGDGAVGQFCIVMPEQDAVIAITSETANMQAIMNAVWDQLLSAMKNEPLPDNAKAEAALKNKLASLTLFPLNKMTGSEQTGKISGKTYNLQSNEMNAEQVTLTFTKNACTFLLKDKAGLYPITCGLDHWINGETMMPGDGTNLVTGDNRSTIKSKVAAAGVWLDDNTFQMDWRYFETPHSDTVTCIFNDNRIQVSFKSSLIGKMGNFKETRPVLEGSMTG